MEELPAAKSPEDAVEHVDQSVLALKASAVIDARELVLDLSAALPSQTAVLSVETPASAPAAALMAAASQPAVDKRRTTLPSGYSSEAPSLLELPDSPWPS